MIYFLTLILFCQQLADWYSTHTIISKGGYEQNPVAKKMMGIMTMDGFLAAKAALVTAIGFGLANISAFAIIPLIAIYVWIIIHNWKSM